MANGGKGGRGRGRGTGNERKKERERRIVTSRVCKDKQSVAERASAHCIRVRDLVDESSPGLHVRVPVDESRRDETRPRFTR